MQKQAGIIDTLLYMPFSALAAAITAPGNQRGRASAIGALIGAGMASMARREYEQRVARGEPVSPTDFNPLFRAVLGGIATGGGARVMQDIRSGKGIRPLSAILAGAPAGALLVSDDPYFGSSIGAVSGLIASKLTEPASRSESKLTPAEFNRLRVALALERSRRRIRLLQEWLANMQPGSALEPSES